MGFFDLFNRYRVHVYRETVTQDTNGVVTGSTWSRVASNVACYKEPLPSTQAAALFGRIEADNMFSMDRFFFAEDADIQAGDFLKNVTTKDDGATPVQDYGEFWRVRGQQQAFASLGILQLGRKQFLASHQQTGPENTALLAGIQGAWQMNEASGATRADSSAGGNDLSLVGLAGASATVVKLGSHSAEFAGAGGWEHAHSAAFALGAGKSFSLISWVNMADRADIRIIASKWNGIPQWSGWTAEYDPVSDRLRFRVSTDGTDQTYFTVTADNLGRPELSTWYLVGSGFDAATNRIWIQVGTPQGVLTRTYQGGVAQVFNNDQVPFRVGLNADAATKYWLGWLDEVSYSNRVVTTDEFAILWDSYRGLEYPYL